MIESIGSFYTQGTNIIRPDLFNEYAEKVAKSLAVVSLKKDERGNVIKDKKGNPIENRYGITSTQLRRLFDEVKRYETLIDDDNLESWSLQYPYIKMIKSKVHYTVARAKKREEKNSKYYDNLSAFISEGIDLIKSVKDYHIFVSLFEAVYGFYYENRPDLKN